MWKSISRMAALVFVALPILCHADALTNADIDRYLKAYPLVIETLDQITAKIKKTDDKQDTKLAIAYMDGRMHRQLVNYIEGWSELEKLRKITRDQGFASINDWALVADRISGVIMSSTWVMGATALSNNNKPLREDLNLFAQ